MHKSALWPALFLILCGLFLLREMEHPVVRAVDARFHDWVAAQGKSPARRSALTIVEINDASMVRDAGWPWRPLDYALFLKAVLPARPGVVGIEPILHWEEEAASRGILQSYVLRTPKLLLAADLDVVRDPDARIIPLPILRKVSGNLAGLPEFAGLGDAPAEEIAERAVLRAVHLPQDSDGHLRRIPMVMRYRGDAIPSFVLQALMLWLQLVPDQVELKIGDSVRLGDVVEVPIDGEGCMQVNFNCLHSVQRIGFEDLLVAVEAGETGVESDFDLSQLARHIVLLGRTDKLARELGVVGQRHVSRVEALAAAIATIQQRGFQRDLTGWPLLAMVVCIGLLCFPAWRLPKSFCLWLTLIVCAAYGMVAVAVYNAQHVFLPIALPFGLMVLLLIMRLLTPRKRN